MANNRYNVIILFTQENEMEKSCNSCKFSDLLNESEPCRTCLLYMADRDWQPFSKWEPKEDDELTLLRAEVARLKAEHEEIVTEEESRAHHLELDNMELRA